MRVIDWIFKNREWIFSGVGVAFLGWFIAYLLKQIKSKRRVDQVSQSISIGGSISQSNVFIGSNNQLLDLKEEKETELTEQEKELLVAASNEGEFFIFYAEQLGNWIRADNNQDFLNQSDPAVAATYLEALKRLRKRNYLEQRSERLFVLNGTGFSVARRLKAM